MALTDILGQVTARAQSLRPNLLPQLGARLGLGGAAPAAARPAMRFGLGDAAPLAARQGGLLHGIIGPKDFESGMTPYRGATPSSVSVDQASGYRRTI